MSLLQTTCTFADFVAASSPRRTVKLNYIADKSFMFFGIDETEHLLKPANSASTIINGNRSGTHSAREPGEREPHTLPPAAAQNEVLTPQRQAG